jgi:hypothetical protein
MMHPPHILGIFLNDNIFSGHMHMILVMLELSRIKHILASSVRRPPLSTVMVYMVVCW